MANVKPRKNLKSQKRGGFYWKNDVPYISVTEILKIPDKPALRWWFGQQVYRAMVINPSMSEQEAMAAPYQSSKGAMNRGTTVHSIVEAYKHTQEHIDTIPENFRGYAKAFYKWVNDYNAVIKNRERSVFSEKHKLAGTLDLEATILNETIPYVIDVKTGKDIYDEAFYQTSAYRQMLIESGEQIKGVAVLLLKEDGEYDFKKRDEEVSLAEYLEIFFLYKRAWEIKHRTMLARYGYQTEKFISISL